MIILSAPDKKDESVTIQYEKYRGSKKEVERTRRFFWSECECEN